MADKKISSGVKIGNVSGGINRSTIAGRDVVRSANSPVPSNRPVDTVPNAPELSQLLVQIQQSLTELAMEKKALVHLSLAASSKIEAAALNVEDANRNICPDGKKTEAITVSKRLSEATSLVSTLLDDVNEIGNKAEDIQDAVMPLAKRLSSLFGQLGTAAVWAAKIWGAI